MAEAFLQIILDNLSSLIQEEIGTIMGVDDEMKKLSSTLTTIQAVLEDAEEKQLESKAIRNWLCKLNDLAYEIDDILDECFTEVGKLQHESSKLRRYNLWNILYRRKIGRRMKKVAKKSDVIAAERSKFHLSEVDLEKQSKMAFTRETGSVLNDIDHVYGRDGEKEMIVDKLLSQERGCQPLSVLAIIGIGGLGKTTLAQLVFKDSRVAKHFDTKLWVCVSNSFDLKTLIKAMIESATGSGNVSDLMCLDTLQQCLWGLLNQKRFLLVLDDVWNEDQEKWSALKNMLACGSKGASVILTTRLKKVADIMSTLPAHYLAGLSKDDCWKLFKQRAFGQEEDQYTNLEAIGKQIVKKCAGVPLAAKTLGGLLRFKREENEWIYVHESEIWNLPEEESSILPALRLSYHHLPLLLRQCFAYCAIFPKGSEIEKEELILQWMAHGYISSDRNLEVEDVGNEIWKELVLRSLFQDVHSTSSKTFKMHDLVHDLAQSIMENKVPGTQTERTKCSLYSKIREVNFKKGYMAFPSCYVPSMDLSSTLRNFSRLRSLNACQTSIDDLPSAIGNLKQLRYLNLSETKIQTLPSTLCNLLNLKILNLNSCFKLVRLPKRMRHMHNLRHVYLEHCRSLTEIPPKIGELTFLKTLSMFIVGHERGNQLQELQFLNLGGYLSIQHLERAESHIDAKKANIAEKRNLRHLLLDWEELKGSTLKENEDEKILGVLEPPSSVETLRISGFKGRKFPPWMGNSTLENIVRIDIWRCPNCLRLPQGLGELPRLKVLNLCSLNVEYLIEDEVGGVRSLRPKFMSLHELKLSFLPNLKGLQKEGTIQLDMFQNLHKLRIRRCPPFILPRLPSVQKLFLHNCGNLTLTTISKLENVDYVWMDTHDQMTAPVSAEGFKTLTKLKSLVIAGAHEKCLGEEELGALKSLKNIEIAGSKTLRSLPEWWVSHLTALENLYVRKCEEFVELPEGIKYLQSLTLVKLCSLPEMTRLPEALQFLPLLKYLFLVKLAQLASIPDWLGNFTNLHTLHIKNCEKVVLLPDVMQEMRSIQDLCISLCPELERRCEKGKGEDWHKIKHIPHLQIGGI